MNYSCLESMVYDLSAPGIIADYYLGMGSSKLFVSFCVYVRGGELLIYLFGSDF